jgi:hypothetical protein
VLPDYRNKPSYMLVLYSCEVVRDQRRSPGKVRNGKGKRPRRGMRSRARSTTNVPLAVVIRHREKVPQWETPGILAALVGGEGRGRFAPWVVAGKIRRPSLGGAW